MAVPKPFLAIIEKASPHRNQKEEVKARPYVFIRTTQLILPRS